jgi:hypothetical protein
MDRGADKMSEIRIDGDVAYVRLSRGLEALVDADDIKLLEGFSWHACKCRRTTYAKYTTPHDADGRQRTVRMHRLIMGFPDGFQVDHINGNGLDNRRANLRVATANENQHNRRPNSKSVSGIKGVTWRHDISMWQAGIGLNGKRKNLGRFRCVTAAALAYAKSSKDMHKEFGRVK